MSSLAGGQISADPFRHAGKVYDPRLPGTGNYGEEHVCIVTLYLMGQFAFSCLDVLDAHRRSGLIFLRMVSYHFDGAASYDICRYMHGVHISVEIAQLVLEFDTAELQTHHLRCRVMSPELITKE